MEQRPAGRRFSWPQHDTGKAVHHLRAPCGCAQFCYPTSPESLKLRHAARLIIVTSRHHHSAPLVQNLHWLPSTERIKYKSAYAACMLSCERRYHAINGFDPYLLPLWTAACLYIHSVPYASILTYSLTDKNKRKMHGFHSSSYFGPYIWNSLRLDLKHCSILSSFKTK